MDGELEQLICFSPAKSIPFTTFRQKYPDITEKIIVNETIFGIEVNLFYDERVERWEIATKKQIGGENTINTGKSIRDLFLQAFSCNDQETIQDLSIIKYLMPYCCYNFVITDSCNRRPSIYLVSVYEIYKKHAVYVPATIYETWHVFSVKDSPILFPRRLANSIGQSDYAFTDLSRPSKTFTHMETGERTTLNLSNDMKYPSNECEYMVYICMRRIGKVKEYLSHFPSDRKLFLKCRDYFDQFLRKIHQAYMEYYVFKTTTRVDEPYKTHIDNLHYRIYLPSLNTDNKVKITPLVVFDYITAY